MTYSIQLTAIIDLLQQENLLKEVVVEDQWIYQLDPASEKNTTLSSIHYHSQACRSGSLFICKGQAFKPAYLDDALQRGASAYMAEELYPVEGCTAIVVTDIRKAMALTAQAFYAYPDQHLKLAGVTATKGKTTTTYFMKDILNAAYPGQVGFISGQEYSLDGSHFHASQLSTPESLDLYGMLAQARDHGLTHMALEISSQAYKLDRLYGLHLDLGLFLNISPDHVSPDEHPSMEDYFWCKRHILRQADHVILSDELDHLDFLYDEAQASAQTVTVYGSDESSSSISYQPLSAQAFELRGSETMDASYHLAVGGRFNIANATAAILACSHLGVDIAAAQEGLAQSRIPGRMEEYTLPHAGRVIIDFAHNYASLKAVLDYAKQTYPDLKRTVVVGSQSHRSRLRWTGIAKALSQGADQVYLTADDPGEMEVADISQAIAEEISRDMTIHLIDDREEAVRTALENSQKDEIIILAGKGTETSQRVKGQDLPYIGDYQILKEYLVQ